ncbi:MAG: V-type ATP synthase subunit D [Kiritimatiellae bacterium]|nr:V-type ATP synthase subunit D [Kiritimatiellia bacterium]
MARIKLTKTELKAQMDALKRFERFLPMLQLKKLQLQSEIASISQKAEDVASREEKFREEISTWAGLLMTAESYLEGLVDVEKIKTSTANIAGVTIPTFEGIDAKVKRVDTWSTPAWLDDASDAILKMLNLKAERIVFEEQLRLVSVELQLTSQRVNLFEKVKIPGCKEAIRVIKIALGDEQTAAVTRGKIAKSRVPAT